MPNNTSTNASADPAAGQKIKNLLGGLAGPGSFTAESILKLLGGLNYESERKAEDIYRSSSTGQDASLKEEGADYDERNTIPFLKYLKEEDWQEIHTIPLVLQFTNDEIRPQDGLFDGKEFNPQNNSCFYFLAVDLLEEKKRSRTNYVRKVRQISRGFETPVIIFLRNGDKLTIAFADCRPSRRDQNKDVITSVSLLHEINTKNPHRAHTDLLTDLNFKKREKWMRDENASYDFEGLRKSWLQVLDVSELNKKFYRELQQWFQRACKEAKFPKAIIKHPGQDDRTVSVEEQVMRLITRILFIWFMKEKKLVPKELFKKSKVSEWLTLKDETKSGGNYYQVVLQNLFFATLCTPIAERDSGQPGKNDPNYHYKYQDLMTGPDPEDLLQEFEKIPFINGGLFECQDHRTAEEKRLIDCFTNDLAERKELSVPDALFFGKNGLFELLNRYKWTVEENTPLTQEVALDPKLLGMTFENLLASLDQDTQEDVRKKTGSYYTPRSIVSYMVQESLTAHLISRVKSDDSEGSVDATEKFSKKVSKLFEENFEESFDKESFTKQETKSLVSEIHSIKVLDPAVGSGAFPMEVLLQLARALKHLDPDNKVWPNWKMKGIEHDTKILKKSNLGEEQFKKNDYLRKLYLIRDNIFGVDVLPIACQIAKLRFFISLIIEQTQNDDRNDNFGIHPLPNLETKIIAANTLFNKNISLLKSKSSTQKIERLILENRKRYFTTHKKQDKKECIALDSKLRGELCEELKKVDPERAEYLTDQILDWDFFNQHISADWFDADWMFGETDGFNLIIGNPPYRQLQKEGGRLGKLYVGQNYHSYEKKGDIYCLFYEKGIQLLKQNGHLCYITSNKWLRSQYGFSMREYLANNSRIKQIINLGANIFSTVAVDTNILLTAKEEPSNRVKTLTCDLSGCDKKNLNSAAGIREVFQKNASKSILRQDGSIWWDIHSDPWIAEITRKVKAKIDEGKGNSLQKWPGISIRRGIVTGCNEVLIINKSHRDQLISEDANSQNLIRPLIRGKEIGRYDINSQDNYLIYIPSSQNKKWPWSEYQKEEEAEKIFLEHHPGVGKYLHSHKDKLKNIVSKKQFYWEADTCAFYKSFEENKIVGKEMLSSPSFFYDREKRIVLDTCLMINVPNVPDTSDASDASNAEYLLGMLNSKLLSFAYKTFYAGGGLGDKGFRYKKSFLKKLPVIIFDPQNSKHQSLVKLVQKINNSVSKDGMSASVKEWINETDQLVYEIYKLTPKEIILIEAEMPLTEKENQV